MPTRSAEFWNFLVKRVNFYTENSQNSAFTAPLACPFCRAGALVLGSHLFFDYKRLGMNCYISAAQKTVYHCAIIVTLCFNYKVFISFDANRCLAFAGPALTCLGFVGSLIINDDEMTDSGREIYDHGKEIYDSGREIYDSGEEMYDCGREIHDSGKEIYDCGREIHDSGKEMCD